MLRPAPPGDTSWLASRPGDRIRLRELERATLAERAAALVLVGVGVVAVAVAVAWWLVLLVLPAIASHVLGPRLVVRASRPERVLLARFCVVQACVAVAVAGTGGGASPAVIWFALMPVAASTRLPGRALLVGMGASGVLAVAAFLVPFGPAPGPGPQAVLSLAALAALAVLLVSVVRVHDRERHGRLIDELTGALTRSALPGRVRETVRSLRGTEVHGALLVLDVDRFKAVNDTYGHRRGDEVLRGLAERIRGVLRPDDVLFRVGGEEFVVVLRCRDAGELAEIGERLRRRAGEAPIDGLPITVSVGGALGPRARLDYDALFALGDAALAEAKGAGRDAVRIRVVDEDARAGPAPSG